MKRPLIILVEDESHMRFLYSEELADEGYNVLALFNGYYIVDIIKCEHPDLVILDIKLLDYDGLDLLSDIRNKYYDLPVILFTAYDTFKEDMKSIAADHYVIKSYDLTELKTKIAMILECNNLSFGDKRSFSASEGMTLDIDRIERYIHTLLNDRINEIINNIKENDHAAWINERTMELKDLIANRLKSPMISNESTVLLFNGTYRRFCEEIKTTAELILGIMSSDCFDIMKSYVDCNRNYLLTSFEQNAAHNALIEQYMHCDNMILKFNQFKDLILQDEINLRGLASV